MTDLIGFLWAMRPALPFLAFLALVSFIGFRLR